MKNAKLIFHRCGLLFMLLTLFLLLIREGENTTEAYTYTFHHAATILIWGLFFGLSFVIFDFKKIPSFVSRIIHFVINGVVMCLWIIAIQTKVESNLLQIIFFAIFIYVVIYWVIHFINVGICKIMKMISKVK